MLRTKLSIAFASLLFAPAAFAQQTGTGTTGSGATVRWPQEITAAIQAIAPEKTATMLSEIVVNEQKETLWRSSLAATRKRIVQNRRECRVEIRKANRDQIMGRIAQCMRTELLLDVTMQRDQMQYMAVVPFADPAIKAAHTGAVLRLIDAEMALVDGLDAGLFETAAALEQAKKNMRITYREPVWLALTRFRADRELTWAVYMSKSIDKRLVETDLPQEVSIALNNAAICLENASLLASSARASNDRLAASAQLKTAQDQLVLCNKILSDMILEERLTAEEKLKESESQN